MNTPYWGTPGNWRYTDIENPPDRTPDMDAQGQFWVWIQGPGGGHFEVKGTGAIWPERDDDTYEERVRARETMKAQAAARIERINSDDLPELHYETDQGVTPRAMIKRGEELDENGERK